ncbi:hypothetical protein L7F22_028664 [Adiantum nelumboides]|nr:hypothetical protein [Adiantum nelumboides]
MRARSSTLRSWMALTFLSKKSRSTMFWCKKKQVKPIKLQGVKPEDMSNGDWDDLDELVRSTIMLTLSKSVYSKKHSEATKGIMHYLNCTRNVCICFGSKGACVEGYIDADYARDMDKRRSTSRYVFMFIGGDVSRQFQSQSCTSMSTTEAEYIASSKACKEAVWLACLVRDLGITADIPTLHCNSQSAMMLAKNPVFHAKTKHIDVTYHFIRDMLEDKLMELVKVCTDDNPANLMTKGLPPEQFAHCRALMDVG